MGCGLHHDLGRAICWQRHSGWLFHTQGSVDDPLADYAIGQPLLSQRFLDVCFDSDLRLLLDADRRCCGSNRYEGLEFVEERSCGLIRVRRHHAYVTFVTKVFPAISSGRL